MPGIRLDRSGNRRSAERYDTYYGLLLPEYQELVDQGIYDLPPLDGP